MKTMCWVGLVNGRVLGPFLVDGNMIREDYQEMLVDHIWPAVRGTVTWNQIWYMQDGATCYTTKDNLNFVFEKLNRRVISNRCHLAP